MKNLCLFLLLYSSTILPMYLDNRPEVLKRSITKTHQKIIDKNPLERWGNCGKENYYLMNLNDIKLIDYMISKKAKNGQKVIRLLDFGSGCFSWPKNLASHLKEKYSTSELKFEIIGVTGDTPLCKISELQIQYNSHNVQLKLIDRMEIESIGQSLGKFDLIVSAWTFLHLTDPFGTLYDLFASLNEGRFILFDGFRFCLGDEEYIAGSLFEYRKLFKSIFERSNARFLGRKYEYEYSLDQFILQKIGDHNLKIPLEYSNKGDIFEKKYDNNSSVTEIAKYIDNQKNYSDIKPDLGEL